MVSLQPNSEKKGCLEDQENIDYGVANTEIHHPTSKHFVGSVWYPTFTLTALGSAQVHSFAAIFVGRLPMNHVHSFVFVVQGLRRHGKG